MLSKKYEMFDNAIYYHKSAFSNALSPTLKFSDYDTKAFYPRGISKKQKIFTANELIDIYIKGNEDIFASMYAARFGCDEWDFAHSEDDWFSELFANRHVLFYDRYRSDKETYYATHKLISTYLEIPDSLMHIGMWAVTCSRGKIPDFAEKFEDVSRISHFKLYCEFFQTIEDIRADSYILSLEDYCRTHPEHTAETLQHIHDTKAKLQDLTKQINEIAGAI